MIKVVWGTVGALGVLAALVLSISDIQSRFFGGNATGTWVGEVSGDNRVYPLSVAIRDDGTTAMATATYPDIPCRGTWIQQSRSRSGISFIENMPEDVDCFDDVPVHIEFKGDSLIFTAESGGFPLQAELRPSSG